MYHDTTKSYYIAKPDKRNKILYILGPNYLEYNDTVEFPITNKIMTLEKTSINSLWSRGLLVAVADQYDLESADDLEEINSSLSSHDFRLVKISFNKVLTIEEASKLLRIPIFDDF